MHLRDVNANSKLKRKQKTEVQQNNRTKKINKGKGKT